MGFFSFLGRVLFASLFILSAWQMYVCILTPFHVHIIFILFIYLFILFYFVSLCHYPGIWNHGIDYLFLLCWKNGFWHLRFELYACLPMGKLLLPWWGYFYFCHFFSRILKKFILCMDVRQWTKRSRKYSIFGQYTWWTKIWLIHGDKRQWQM